MFSPTPLLLLASLVTSVYSATLNVSTTGGNASSPLLYGLMFEVHPRSLPFPGTH